VLKRCCCVSCISVEGDDERMTRRLWRFRVTGVCRLTLAVVSCAEARTAVVSDEAVWRVSLRLFAGPSCSQSSLGCFEPLGEWEYFRKGCFSFRFRSFQRAIKSSLTSAAFLCTQSDRGAHNSEWRPQTHSGFQTAPVLGWGSHSTRYFPAFSSTISVTGHSSAFRNLSGNSSFSSNVGSVVEYTGFAVDIRRFTFNVSEALRLAGRAIMRVCLVRRRGPWSQIIGELLSHKI
jgi:hypothetical protein